MVGILKSLIFNIVINAILLYVMANYIPDLGFTVQWWGDVLVSFILIGTVFWIINDVLRNIIQTITLPFKFLTLGLSSIIINIGVIYLFEYVINTYMQNISVWLGTTIQVAWMSLIITVAYFIIKKVL